MLAARFHAFGGPEILRVEEIPWPWPSRDEVLVRVGASSVNGSDLRVRAGGGPAALAVRRPYTTGLDVAGVVVGVGPRVTAFEPGERVFGLLGHGGGGAAEYVTVPQSRLAHLPDRLDWAEAAAIPLSGLTALQALREGAALHRRPGARVLVYGAAGGIGSFAVGLARHFGAVVTGVARAAKLDFVRALGADEVHDAADLDLGRGERTWDVIFDTPPALDFARVRASLAPGGVYVTTQPFPLRPAELAASLGGPPGPRPRFAAVRTQERSPDLAFLARLVASGELRVPLDRTFPLAQIADAHRHVEGPQARGKTVVQVSP
ncbi:NADPH:quinone reductase-like Zn-dependent oxidoreductase [Deinococcus sp. HSC-46F16]|uniref:NAD(P)-dependent alcohol dehydrogenase n=1 Tax=Deinococcus sp. HSC-46F16 TaxID=2910968 RepID=UPI0020A05594|nr:NAD(P)-dependent alcohol dehydrogenase [Deinococcus sp. HSC-46F16]MCP2014500.1 NADPH:quinone reductase-like Zn-dependent oxidoreductase [Deinococcus sp. HSC-46F16]